MEAQQLAALRNRENQRRSRARRKDYIQELEQRLREHEAVGVKVTAEVQAAAKKVSEENMGLRSLLGICGVDNGRIEQFLRTRDASFVSKDRDHSLETIAVLNKSLPQERDSLECSARVDRRTPPAPETNLCMKGTQDVAKTPQEFISVYSNTTPSVHTVSNDGIPSELVTIDHIEGHAQPTTNEATSSTAPDILVSKANFSSLNDQAQLSGARDEISCLAAAEIIAGMRGHDNPEEVWPELGCSSSRRCMVKNMAIFQMMDR